jgi:hypothetical protein
MVFFPNSNQNIKFSALLYIWFAFTMDNADHNCKIQMCGLNSTALKLSFHTFWKFFSQSLIITIGKRYENMCYRYGPKYEEKIELLFFLSFHKHLH